MKAQTKELDFEVNLLPVLSVLSICICFLLTAAVWSRMGYIGVNQAIGDEIPTAGINPDSVVLKILSNGFYLLQWKKGLDSSIISEKKLPFQISKNWSSDLIKKEISHFISSTKVTTVVVMPEKGVKYGQTIQILDVLKSLSLSVGIAPAIDSLHSLKGSKK